MNSEQIIRLAIEPAYFLLPGDMASNEATVMLLAIGLQESRFKHRRQINGPARGFWQFEIAGVRGVMEHHATRGVAAQVLSALEYGDDVEQIHGALEHNDVLAAAFARLLLWTHPRPLPVSGTEAWDYYLETWRPGRPRPASWDTAWSSAMHAQFAYA